MENKLAELDLELLRRDARALTRTADWENQLEIAARLDKERNRQERIFTRDKDKRIEMATRRIAERNGFDLAALRRRSDARSAHLKMRLHAHAVRDVDRDHIRRIGQINRSEAKELQALIDAVRDRENGPQPSHAPKRLTDQRNAPDRLPFNRSR